MMSRHHLFEAVRDGLAKGFSFTYALELSCQIRVRILLTMQTCDKTDEVFPELSANQFNYFPEKLMERKMLGIFALLQRLKSGYS
ncbi:MAG: hypothetical protein CML56_05470 [Rhodobacteraceae bacterium]|nr:hypothetical protein [Paracoccaceae bacterium]|tara:strand:+ start:625 stop:879 length:255 start_codon:yes stop_codon:yes gene_type:complete